MKLKRPDNADSWWQFAAEHDEKIKSLIRNYHPTANRRSKVARITAGLAEQACAAMAKEIAKETAGTSPVEGYAEALKSKDATAALQILNETWFGVPETTDCWQIDGFREAVILMEEEYLLESEPDSGK